jgi:hypothetical protein
LPLVPQRGQLTGPAMRQRMDLDGPGSRVSDFPPRAP